MLFKKITKEDIAQFAEFISEQYIINHSNELFEKYTHDCTEDLKFTPEIILLPANAQEISDILKYCTKENIAVTPRGAGTGLSGGALSVHGGIILSTERLNKIVKIDEQNFQATVEPAVINETLQQAVKEKGLYYPPDPASKGSCFLGGNVAHASGGPKAVKYGTTRDYVLNLEVVLPSGEIIWTGANTLKYSSGYNLTHLIIGSEGTLCIITKIVFKLIPYPPFTKLMMCTFASPEEACKAVNAIFISGCTPSVCEFIEPDGFRLSAAFSKLNFVIEENVNAYLLIEVDGFDNEKLQNDCEKIYNAIEQYGLINMDFAEDETQKEFFWKLRRTIGEATKQNNVYKEEDTVVPRNELPILYKRVKEIGVKYNIRTVCYGHAGDGNLHVNILKDDMSDERWNTEITHAIKEIFEICKELNGTISGEHGIGFVQKNYLPIVLLETNLIIMRGIKKVFDPAGILNPGKIF
jgi:glycolate oxidase